MNPTLEAIARDLGIDTLEERGMDDLDFHQVHVARLREALKAAYRAGRHHDAPLCSACEFRLYDHAPGAHLVTCPRRRGQVPA